MPNDLCSMDKMQPADNTIESAWPGYLRDAKEQLLNSFLLEHICSGRHLSGVDTIGGGTNMQVDVGGASGLVGAPYAGLFVHVKPIADNTAGGILTVKSGAGTIAAGPIKLNGADPTAGAIKNGRWLECIWDGTNWQVISGWDAATTASPASPIKGVIKASNQSVTNSTTLVNVTDFAIPITSTKKYRFWFDLYVSLGATGGLFLNCLPGMVCLFSINAFKQGSGGINLQSSDTFASFHAGSPKPVDYGSNQTRALVQMFGSFVAPSTTNFQLQFAQRVSNGTPTTILGGSLMTLQELF